MAPFLFLLLFLSGAASDLIVVTVPGDFVILPCQAVGSSIRVVEWTRPDLRPEYVLLNRDEHLNTTHQHPSFKDRVKLLERNLIGGYVSLLLENVRRHDTGTYECRVITDDTNRIRTIRTVRLQVRDLVVVTKIGDDVILPCQAADSSIRVVVWSRTDLELYIILYYRDGKLETANQTPSFKDRVELVDRELQDGNVSLTLKNVSRHDAGTYECRVTSGGTEPIRIIRLIVTEPDLIVVTVPGDDVILPCQADDSSIRAVEWSRPDLEPDTVLLYRDGQLDPTLQHPSFKDRVELVDRDLKDGDVSLILKNVNIHDAGEYECGVETDDHITTMRTIRINRTVKIIRTIYLQVTEPAGSEDGNSSPVGRYVGLAAGVLVLVAAAVVGVLKYKRHKDKRSGPPAVDVEAGH